MIHTYPLVTKRKDPTKQNHTKKHHQKRQGTASCGRSKKPSLARKKKGPWSLRCPRATSNRVDVTTRRKTFLKLTLKLCPVNNNLKKDFSTPLKFTLACSIQRALGSSICSNEMLLDTIRAKVFMLNAKRKKWREGENKRISQKLRCASCGDIHVASPCTQETWTLSHPSHPTPKTSKTHGLLEAPIP